MGQKSSPTERDSELGHQEKIRTVVVENFPMLGKAAAWRFLEWAQENPKGSGFSNRRHGARLCGRWELKLDGDMYIMYTMYILFYILLLYKYIYIYLDLDHMGKIYYLQYMVICVAHLGKSYGFIRILKAPWGVLLSDWVTLIFSDVTMNHFRHLRMAIYTYTHIYIYIYIINT